MEIGGDETCNDGNNADVKKPELKTHSFRDKVDRCFGGCIDSYIQVS